MIFTRSWLSEFVDITNISDIEILETLNRVGLEVASYKKIEIPKGVLVGKIIDFEKHPDADKLSVCKVDNGKTLIDVVCGAKNVKKGAYVALASVGAHLPGGVIIKQAELRGVQSYGMLCSATELGLPKLNDGIMILDHSLERLKIGDELSSVSQIADSVFEVEITPNRGDCLSVRGIAREIAAYYGLELKEIDGKKIKESEKGIGRIISVHSQSKTTANAVFRVFEKSEGFDEERFLVDYRLSLIGETENDRLKSICAYISHAVGINLSFFGESAFGKTDEKIDIYLEISDDKFEEIRGKERALSIGVIQQSDSYPKEDDKNIIVAATYVAPASLLALQDEIEQKDDALYYKSSRGSEPDLAMGLNYACEMMSVCCGFAFYAGYVEDFKPLGREPIKVDINKINTIIGSTLDKNHIVNLLRKLYFDVTVNAEFDSCAVLAPNFRHDISNVYDLAEEIVRIKGIDTIESKPLEMTEAPRINESITNYRFLKNIRQNAAAVGFFETVHFIFADRGLQEQFGFECLSGDADLINPITSELNTLRSTLLLGLLSSASKNAKNSRGKIALFESGVVFNKKREERSLISFVWSNDLEDDSIKNGGKPKGVDFQSFASKLADIFGGFELSIYEAKGGFLHPYQCAHIIKDGVNIGFTAKLHPKAEEFFGLKSCFVCEIETSKLPQNPKKASEFSKFQKSIRDLSLEIPSDLSYAPIRKCIEEVANPLIKSFYPVDIYKSKPNAKEMSLTVRFELQSNEKTLEEKDITSAMEQLLQKLANELKVGLKQ